MLNLKKFLNNKILFLGSIFCLSFVVFFPLKLFGLSQLEEYHSGIFSTYLMFVNLDITQYLNTFFAQISSGIKLPMGQGLFLYPTSLLMFNLSLFYFFTITTNFIIQFYYFNRIIFSITKENLYFISFLFLINISNFSYLYFTDWISCFVTFTLFLPIIYYAIQFNKKNKNISLFKLTIFISLIILNGHLGFAINIIYFLIIFFLVNKNFRFLKNKIFYILFFLFIFVVSERLFDILVVYFDSINLPDFSYESYKIQDYIYGISKFYFTPVNIFEKFFNLENIYNINAINGREVVYGITFIISLGYSINSIIKKKSKKIYYIDIIFLIFIIASFFKYDWLPKLSGTWQSRDLIQILGFLLIAIFLINLKMEKSRHYSIILFVIILNKFFLLAESINHVKVFGKFKIDNISKINKKFLPEVSKNRKIFQRLYVSPNIYDEIIFKKNSYLTENFIYDFNDFIKYNLSPVNYAIKNQSNILRGMKIKMYTHITPDLREMNSDNFLDFLMVDYILLKKEEQNKILPKNFFVKKNYEDQNINLVLLEREKKEINILSQNFEENINFCKKKYPAIIELVSCLYEEDILSKNGNIKLEKLSSNKFLLSNKNNFDAKVVLPFIGKKNFLGDKKIDYFLNHFAYVNLKKGESRQILLKDNTKYRLRLISLISFFLLLLFTILSKKSYISKSKNLN